MHAIIFSTKEPKIIFPRKLKLQGGCWGTLQNTYLDPQSKFSYWFNAFVQNTQWELLTNCALKEGIDLDQFLSVGKRQLNSQVCEQAIIKCAENLQGILEFLSEKRVKLFFKASRNACFNIDASCFTMKKDRSLAKSIKDYIEIFKKINLNYLPKDTYHPTFEYLVNVAGGIDHQSDPRSDEDCKKLATMSAHGVFNWVFGDGYFKTGSDYDF